MVDADIAVTFPATASGAAVLIGGLPYAAAPGSWRGWINYSAAAGVPLSRVFGVGSGAGFHATPGGVSITNSQLSGNIIRFTVRIAQSTRSESSSRAGCSSSCERSASQ